ncbi:MAG TPA: hypothetical protein VH482_22265 [Thermomicrobiales bacterium]|jgi:hypothetical protein
MENRQFEELAKALAGGAPRRKVLKGLLGGALGSALAVVGLKERSAEAKTCRSNQKLCNGHCISASRCCIDQTCVATCVAACFGINAGSFSLNQAFTLNHQAGCETQCLKSCSSGKCP